MRQAPAALGAPLRVDHGGAAIQEPHLQGSDWSLTHCSATLGSSKSTSSLRLSPIGPPVALFEEGYVARTAPLSRTIQRPRASGKDGRLCTGAYGFQSCLLCHVK